MQIKKAIVFIAHPDDEVLGMGATIRKLSDKGVNFRVVYFNGGFQDRPGYDKEVLKNQIEKASSIIGVRSLRIEYFVASEFALTPQNQFNEICNEEVSRFKPDTIFTHIQGDLHRDHKVISEAAFVASRFKDKATVKNLLCFPTLSSSEINPMFNFNANFLVNVSDSNIHSKISAMTQYEFELLSMPKLRGDYGIKTWAQYYGLQAACRYAEPFQIIRSVL